jgi:hypothetical protein
VAAVRWSMVRDRSGGQLSKGHGRTEGMAEGIKGWSVEVESVEDAWWCSVTLVCTWGSEVTEDGPFATVEAALDAGHKIAYDVWQQAQEQFE